MRDIPGLSADILARAEALAQKPMQLPGRKRDEAKNVMPAPKVKDGVATLRLYDVIDPDGGYWGISGLEFAEVLDTLDSDVSEIRLHVNSRGGSVWDGLAMVNSLRQFDGQVTAVVDGIAASAASFITAACDTAVMMPQSQMMLHDALGICVGQAEDMRAYAKFLDDSSDNIAAIYAARTGGSVAAWRAVMMSNGLDGRWYTPEQAKADGLVDHVGLEDATSADDPPTDRSEDLSGADNSAPETPAGLSDSERLRIRSSLSLRQRSARPRA